MRVLEKVKRCRLRIGLLQRQQREFGGLFHVAAPVGLRVVLRVGVLEDHAGGVGRCIRHEGQVGRFTPLAERAVGAHAHLCVKVVVVAARALVGIDHRAALRQAPRCGHRHRAIDAARTGGRRDQHAAFAGVEVVRHLCQHAVRLLRTEQARIGRILAARHRVGAAEHVAITTARGEVGDAAPAAPQRAAAQFLHGGRGGVGECRRRHTAQARQTEARGQQVVVAAVFTAQFVAEHGRLHGLGSRTTGAGGQTETDGEAASGAQEGSIHANTLEQGVPVAPSYFRTTRAGALAVSLAASPTVSWSSRWTASCKAAPRW